ncbi:MAG TPA: hypothetical protein VE131_12050, partial [Terriglobales bacterium]|nr:hypothetical protein [Terriglobales bacterium]
MRKLSFSTPWGGLVKFFATLVLMTYGLTIPVSAQEPSKDLIDAAKKEGQVTYWGTNGEVALKIFGPFLKRYGLKLEV